jgi:hypothetical protein
LQIFGAKTAGVDLAVDAEEESSVGSHVYHCPTPPACLAPSLTGTEDNRHPSPTRNAAVVIINVIDRCATSLVQRISFTRDSSMKKVIRSLPASYLRCGNAETILSISNTSLFCSGM